MELGLLGENSLNIFGNMVHFPPIVHVIEIYVYRAWKPGLKTYACCKHFETKRRKNCTFKFHYSFFLHCGEIFFQKMNRERYYGCDSNLEESASLQLFLEHQIHSCLRFSPQKMIYVWLKISAIWYIKWSHYLLTACMHCAILIFH